MTTNRTSTSKSKATTKAEWNLEMARKAERQAAVCWTEGDYNGRNWYASQANMYRVYAKRCEMNGK
jgi:hypothetical protein